MKKRKVAGCMLVAAMILMWATAITCVFIGAMIA